jgi:ribosomal protein S14
MEQARVRSAGYVRAMPTAQLCHLPYRFVNRRQRCSRCGETLEVEEKLAQDTHFWVCRNTDGTEGEFVGPGAALLSHQRKCDERPWSDVMGHIAGPHTKDGQPCARCGEDLSWVFKGEPLGTGTTCTISIEGKPGDYVIPSRSTSVKPGTPLCL